MLFKYFLGLVSLFFIFCKGKNTPTKSIQSFTINQKILPVFDYDTTIWTDIGLIDSTIILDLKYATEDNFVREKMYECGRCFLRPEVAKRIVKAHEFLKPKGLKLKLFDCYRPQPIQEKLWRKVPNPSYVTPPWKGSMHNKGLAVDLTITNEFGEELDMGSPYDFFGPEAHHSYQNHSPLINKNRKLLKDLMESLDLRPIRTEWWHYSYQKKPYDLSKIQWNCSN